MDRGATFWLLLGAILLAGLGLRVGAAFWWQSRLEGKKEVFAFPDSDTYWQLGRTIVHGERYQYGTDGTLRIFRMPGYPALLAGMFLLTGDDPKETWPYLAARLMGAGIGTLVVGMIALVTLQLFSERAALLAAAIAACEPLTVGTSIFILTECPFTLCMLAQFLAMIVAQRHEEAPRRNGLAFVAGIAAGLATLIRPSWWLFTPLMGVLGTVFARERVKMMWFALAMQVGLMLTMCPWWIRNWQETGRYVPTTLQFGASLYDGLNPKANGGSEMSFVKDFRAAQEEFDKQNPNAEGNFELRVDWRLRDAAVEWAMENPGQALTLAVIKFWRMWSPWPNEPSLQGSWAVLIGCTVTFVPLMAFALVGAWRFASRGYGYWLCLVPAVYLTSLHMIFVSSIRYRQPPLLPLMILAAGAIAAWLWGDEPVGPAVPDSCEPSKQTMSGTAGPTTKSDAARQ